MTATASTATTVDALAHCAMRESHSQMREDLLLLPTLVGAARGNASSGVFVEIGALDGKTYSNTLMLESCFGWRGVLIEANPLSFAKLNASGRRANFVHSAVCGADDRRGVVRISLDGKETAGELSFLTKGRQASRRNRMVDVPCKPLGSILLDNGVSKADFLSVDVEGAEHKVLATVSPNAFQVILVERNKASDKGVARIMHAASMRMSKTLRVPLSDVWLQPGVDERALRGAGESRRMKFENAVRPKISVFSLSEAMSMAMAGRHE